MNIHHAFRLLWKNPGFTGLAVFILALGIGANTAIFTLIDTLLLRPLPYRDAARLALVTSINQGEDASAGCISYPRLTMLLEHNRVFSGLAAYASDTLNLTNRGLAEQLQAGRVSWNFFDVLGVQPAIGRGFRAEEGSAGAKPVVLISDALWRRKFNATSEIVGQTTTLDGRVYTIAGVLPHSFTFGFLGNKTELWVPRIDELSLMDSAHLRSGVCYLNAVARLAPGISLTQASAQMAVLGRQYSQEYAKMPDSRKTMDVESLQETLVGGFRPTLLVLSAAVAVVLLIACANVASLLLARALTRRREVAIRTSLGATSGHLIRQMLTESMLLAFLAGICGVLLSTWGTEVLSAKVADFVPRASEIARAADLHVLAFAVGVSLLAGILFGLAPAMQFASAGLAGILREEGRGVAGTRKRLRLRNVLVAAQVALCVVLLVGAGLLIRTFLRLVTLPPGFDPNGTLTMTLALPSSKYATGRQMVDFFEQVLNRVEALPGVQSAAISSALPVNPARRSPALMEGQPAVPLTERPFVYVQTFAHSYLQTLGVPLIRGRTFTVHDTQTSQSVALVNETLARKFFPNVDPVGRRIWLGRRTQAAEIVGVIGDVKNVTLSTETAPEIDVPFSQLPWASMYLTIRTSGDPARLSNAIRGQIAAVDKDQPVTDVQTLNDVLSTARAQPRVITSLLAVFAAVAFLLAIVGLYGVISYSVSQRTQEMGVRMALGASRTDVIGMVVRQGVALALVGIAAGVLVSFVATRLVATLIYGVTTTDPLTFVVSPALFLIFAVLASTIPALRATRIDPCEALRKE